MRVARPGTLLGTPARAARALAACGLAACFGSLPARELYRLRPVAPEAPPANAGGTGAGRAADAGAPAEAGAALFVEPYATPGVYGEPGIVYRVGDAQYGNYPNREWALPLGGMLATLTAGALAQVDGAPRRVEDGANAGRGTAARGLVWRGVVREFEEVDRGRQVTAAVWLDARLVRAADDSVLWQGSARLERPVTPPDQMTAVVDGLSDAAQRTVAQLAEAAAPALRRAAAARAAAGPGGG